MNRKIVVILLGLASSGWSAEVSLAPHELFQIPFGTQPEQLGTRIENNSLMIPRDFTLDHHFHFYINDSANHRVVRYSWEGRYQMAFHYPTTAGQVFSQTDNHDNLWLLISDPTRGLYFGVYDTNGKKVREGLFAQYDQFHLHVDDDGSLHVLLSSTKTPSSEQTYSFDEDSLLLERETIARPPEDHHQIRRQDHVYYTDLVPGGSKTNTPVTRITDASHHGVAAIEGTVIYITARGDIYTRISLRELHIYDANGALEGKVRLQGLSASCTTLRFDSDGDIFQLDGIPDSKPASSASDDAQYNSQMRGMRMVEWQR